MCSFHLVIQICVDNLFKGVNVIESILRTGYLGERLPEGCQGFVRSIVRVDNLTESYIGEGVDYIAKLVDLLLVAKHAPIIFGGKGEACRDARLDSIKVCVADL